MVYDLEAYISCTKHWKLANHRKHVSGVARENMSLQSVSKKRFIANHQVT